MGFPGEGALGEPSGGAPWLEWVRKAPWGRKGWAGPEGAPGALLAPGPASHRPLAGAGLLRGPAGRASPVDRPLTSGLQEDWGAVSVAQEPASPACGFLGLGHPPALAASGSAVPPGPQQPARPPVTAAATPLPWEEGAGQHLLWSRERGGDRCAGGELSSVTQPPPSPVPSKVGLTPPLGWPWGAGICLLLTAHSRSSGQIAHLAHPPGHSGPSPQLPTHSLPKPEQLRSPRWGPNTRARAHGGSWAWALGSP